MNVADVFLMASRLTRSGDCEGFGIAVVEAALCGTPAIVTATSGTFEAIEDGRTGLAVPENDPDSTAEAAIRLLSDRSLLKAMGDRARRRSASQQTWSHVASRYDNLLTRMSGYDERVPIPNNFRRGM
jgi:phosphatidylinositol alpha-1,6-mannosyltransferase